MGAPELGAGAATSSCEAPPSTLGAGSALLLVLALAPPLPFGLGVALGLPFAFGAGAPPSSDEDNSFTEANTAMGCRNKKGMTSREGRQIKVLVAP